ncbi:ferric/cupric reductase transmembrane component 7 [Acrodontium crateriforme]|uniref:ferric-chelate reductase (NADPH) n=1 Tax=Acrodontium crateriforme TaxID=150365 RepID=A0AAQ3M0G3_9PEZI|nr:ferric/cupric reductase transmembrane component 7 [Acrodontium crateriforme]
MSGMDMSGMGGMDMSTSGLFTPVNMKIARAYWGMIAGAVGFLACLRFVSIIQSRRRRNVASKSPHAIPSRPNGVVSQAYATATASLREMSYPQPIYFTGRLSKYFSPMPVGQSLVLVVYWIVLLAFLWTGTILEKDDPMYAYKWEKVGFRAAWVSVSQIPFVYLLSCKFNPISILTGISYERFNWLHRWAARTVFLTLIVHWSFFFTEWSLADMVQMEFEMMSMVKYGFGAWSVIGWMVLSGFGFFRKMNYELFVAQHICAAAVLLWLIFIHVPAYARYNVYMAIGFVAFDWTARIVWNVSRNTHIFGSSGAKFPGYSAQAEILPGNMVRLTVEDIDFQWKAGQHVRLSIPCLRPFELHPFTIANTSSSMPNHHMTMVIKAHSGFSKVLHSTAVKSPSRNYRAFISGPWGSPPDLSHFETVVLIACSSGASFTTPLVEELFKNPSCAKTVVLHWIVRSREHFQWFGSTLENVVKLAQETQFSLQVIIHITQSLEPSILFSNRTSLQTAQIQKYAPNEDARSLEGSSSGDSVSSTMDEKSPLSSSYRRLAPASLTMRYSGRPTVESMIRSPVEHALGETAVVVCGGLSITAEVRNFVTALSDERAVHKGTGAQGIYLFAESFGW